MGLCTLGLIIPRFSFLKLHRPQKPIDLSLAERVMSVWSGLRTIPWDTSVPYPAYSWPHFSKVNAAECLWKSQAESNRKMHKSSLHTDVLDIGGSRSSLALERPQSCAYALLWACCPDDWPLLGHATSPSCLSKWSCPIERLLAFDVWYKGLYSRLVRGSLPIQYFHQRSLPHYPIGPRTMILEVTADMKHTARYKSV